MDELRRYQKRTVRYLVRGQEDIYREMHAGDKTLQMAAAKKGRGVVYADMGLGKTLIGISAYQELCPGEPLLIVGTKRAFNTWRRELLKWNVCEEKDITFIDGSPQKRQRMWRNPTRIMIVNYDCLNRDMSEAVHYLQRMRVRLILFDEAQRMRNRKTKAFINGKKLTQRVPYVIFLSGSLVTRGPQDLWTYMHMCDPRRFNTYWKFIHAFCIIVETPFGQEIAGPRNTESIGREFSRHLIRLKDKDPEVINERPPLTRDTIPIDPTPEQRRLHDQLLRDMYMERDDGSIMAAPNAATVVTKLRQLMVCPRIIDPALGWGANIDFIMDVMEEDPHIVIFTPFRDGIKWLNEAIVAKGHPNPFILMGGHSSDDVRRVEEGFGHPDSKHTSCLCTVQFAESFELPSAKQCYFNGFDWSQLTNYQAEKRLHRLTTPHPVNSFYLVGKGTVEEDVLAMLNKKQYNTSLTLQNYIDVLAERLNKRAA